MELARLVGLFVVLIGILSGGVLVAQPFATNLDTNPLAMAMLFGTCLVAGLPLYASGQRRDVALRVSGGALVALGLFSLLGIFVDAAGLVPAQRTTLALWLVGPISLLVGLLLAHFARAQAQ